MQTFRALVFVLAAGGFLAPAGSEPAQAVPQAQSGAAQNAPAGDPVRDLLKRAADLVGGPSRADKASEVLGFLEPLLQSDAVNADRALRGDVHYWIAIAYYRSTKYADAVSHFESAIADERAAGDRRNESRTLRMLGQLRKNQGAYAEGLAACEQALAIDQAIGNDRGVALDAIVSGAIHDLMGDHRGALASFEKALPFFESQTSAETGNLFNEIAITQKNLGNYGEALKYYDRALAQYEALKNPSGQISPLMNMGVLYATIGEVERGVRYFEQALSLTRQMKDRRGEMIVLLSLGDCYWELSQPDKAVETLTRALNLSREQGARSEENVTLKSLGDIYAAKGDLPLARQHYDAALRIQQEIGERRMEASTRIALSDLALREGDAASALASARRALELAQSGSRPEAEWSARRALARADAAGGNARDAIDQLRASVRIINDLRATVVSDSSKIAFLDQRQGTFQDLALLLVQDGQSGEALEVAEAGRARAFADLLEQRQVLGKPAERDSLEAVRRAESDFRTASQKAAPASPASDASLARTRAAAALDTSLAALTAEHHELASLVTAESPSARQIADTARRLDASLVEYLVTPKQLLIWVVAPDGTLRAATVDAGRERLEALTTAVRTRIDESVRNGFGASPRLRSSLRELDRVLIAPVASWLPASPGASVVIIPHGSLALLPFGAFEDASGRPLAERYTLSFAPAASIYRHTRDKVDEASSRPRAAMVVADPTAPPESGLDPLPGAREEARLVAQRLKSAPVRTLTGSSATEAAIKHDAGQYSLLHFATHGSIVPDRPLSSSILLAAGGGEDGYLRVDEVVNLDLHADLIVLSGCSTALGKLSGDGIIGLTRAFIYAGTPSIVVSQWDVSDRATAFLMDAFYRSLQQGASKAAALRSAQLSTRRRFPHPALWSAFMLVGEPR